MIKPKFNAQKLKADLKKRVERINQAIVSRLQLTGEEFVNNARISGNYGDITGNLRSSIGYLVMFQGKIISGSSFDAIKQGGEGSKMGLNYIKKIASKYKDNGFVLIVVAGMNYAAAVESKGFDVITGSSLIAEQDLKTAFAKIKTNLKK